jgi:UDP-N-acetylmuramyl pentapeptide synthase
MNELGKHSKELHEQTGKLCDPKQINLVVTIGKDANKYLASEAEKRGCKVMRCPSPYHAADVVRPLLKKEAVILAKGSQNGVFAEEALKELLADAKDAKKLVRQSRRWLKYKESHFHDV